MDDLTAGVGQMSINIQNEHAQGQASKKKRRRRPGRPSSPDVVESWNGYFGAGDLCDWQRFMADLGLVGDFSSKTKCRKALENVWINIQDFLECVDRPAGLHFFNSQRELAQYTLASGKVYPKNKIQKHDPLRKLLAHIRRHHS